MKNGIITTAELLSVRLREGSVASCCRENPFLGPSAGTGWLRDLGKLSGLGLVSPDQAGSVIGHVPEGDSEFYQDVFPMQHKYNTWRRKVKFPVWGLSQ